MQKERADKRAEEKVDCAVLQELQVDSAVQAYTVDYVGLRVFP